MTISYRVDKFCVAGATGIPRAAVRRSHEEDGFVPAEFFARAGIEVDLANYAAHRTR